MPNTGCAPEAAADASDITPAGAAGPAAAAAATQGPAPGACGPDHDHEHDGEFGGLIRTMHLSEHLPLVRCVDPTEAHFVHQHVFLGRVGGYGLSLYGIELRPGATIVDVGSNIGNFAMWALVTLKGNVRLVTVEPIPVLAACLAANVQHYSVPGVTRATVVNAGATSPAKAQAGVATMSFSPSYTLLSTMQPFGRQEVEVMARGLEHLTAGSHEREELRRVVEGNLRGPGSGEVEVRLTTLSDVLAQEEGLSQIDLLKIDAVKAELDILEGIMDADWAKVRQVVIDVHLGSDVGRLDSVMAVLRSKGFANVRTGWPGTPTFLAYKEYGILRSHHAPAAAALAAAAAAAAAAGGGEGEGAAAAAASTVISGLVPGPCGSETAQQAGPQSGQQPGQQAGQQEGQEGAARALPQPPKPSLGEHLLCTVYATR